MIARQHRYGYIPDLKDERDHTYFLFHHITLPGATPNIVDLRPKCSPIEDQKDLGSCTANALAGALEFLENKDGVKFKDASRLFIYFNERVIENSIASDSGAMIRDGIKTLNKQGFCSEVSWPYKIANFSVRPPLTCYTEALNNTISSYARIMNFNDMVNCLANGFPFVAGISVYESFESDAVAKTGMVPMPKKGESLLGGHAICVVGYDTTKKLFICRNSWGLGWGDKGYFYLPFAYAQSTSLTSDCWSIRAGKGI